MHRKCSLICQLTNKSSFVISKCRVRNSDEVKLKSFSFRFIAKRMTSSFWNGSLAIPQQRGMVFTKYIMPYNFKLGCSIADFHFFFLSKTNFRLYVSAVILLGTHPLTPNSGFNPGTPVFTHFTSARWRYAPHDVVMTWR